ncbi:hypothetical protein ACVBEH_14710 [Roseateles sp. GG27B]
MQMLTQGGRSRMCGGRVDPGRPQGQQMSPQGRAFMGQLES